MHAPRARAISPFSPLTRLESAGVWDESLLIVTSDNGGQADLMYGGGSNYPLRGGKGSFFEGGTRVMGLVSGGLVPPARRGAVERGLMHGADWLATLCGVLGAADACREDERARAAGLPPLDSLDMVRSAAQRSAL
jgi:arylsulfatase A-like enzyme